jgi:hypothetical protein
MFRLPYKANTWFASLKGFLTREKFPLLPKIRCDYSRFKYSRASSSSGNSLSSA